MTENLPVKSKKKTTAKKKAVATVKQPEDNQSLVSMFGDMARDPSIDVEKMQAMFEIYEKLNTEKARLSFLTEFARIRPLIAPIFKTSDVNFTAKGHNVSYSHVDINQLMKTIDKALVENKSTIHYRFTSFEKDNRIGVSCILADHLGHVVETKLHAPIDATGSKNAHQAIGSAITYLQRYTLNLAWGLSASHDDDGNQSANVNEKKKDILTDGSLKKTLEAWTVKIKKANTIEEIDGLAKSLQASKRIDKSVLAKIRSVWGERRAALRKAEQQSLDETDDVKKSPPK